MKTIWKAVAVTAVAAALLVAVAPRPAQAGNDDWETAGLVIAGIATVGLIVAIASHHDHAPAPAAHRCQPPPPPRWIPGHYELRREKVCLPGHWETVTVPAEYRAIGHGHHARRVLVRVECTRRVWVPERSEWKETQVWIPGHYEQAERHARAW